MTKIIGLTGGIGSGKSTIAQLFASHGIPVYNADNEARKIMNTKSIVHQIGVEFGKEIINQGKIDRLKLANIVFKQPEKLAILNSIIHPEVHNHFKKWLTNKKKFPFIVKEVAILFETGGEINCEKTITVVAPKELRIKRVMERDKTTRESVLARMNNQWTDEQRIAKSDFVIENIDFESTKLKVEEILKVLNNL